MSHRAAFNWNEKGEATLRSFECECGEQVVGEPDEIIDVDAETEIVCDICGAVYEPTFLVRLVKQEEGKSVEADGVIETATGLIVSEAVDSPVQLYYRSSISDNVKDVAGKITALERGYRAKIEATGDEVADAGDTLEVIGSEVSDREEGTVLKNGRKIGMFEEVEIL